MNNEGDNRCLQCGAENPKNAGFCMQCGARLLRAAGIVCPKCGKTVKRGKLCMNCGYMLADFCPHCGEEIHVQDNAEFCPLCGRKL